MGARSFHCVVPLGQSGGLFPGIASLYNVQPGATVAVRRVEVLAPGGQSPLGLGKIELQRGDYPAPTDLSEASVVHPVKHDTASDDPSDLVCWTSPLFDPPAPPSTLRSILDVPTTTQGAGGMMGARIAMGGCASSGLRNGTLLACGGLSGVEPVVLKYGANALCIVQTQAGVPHGARVAIEVRRVSTGATYVYTTRVNTVAPDPLKPILALWSYGLEAWEVRRVDWVVESLATPLAGLRLVRTEGDYTTDGVAEVAPVVPAAHDSIFPCPNGIRGVSGVLRAVAPGKSAGVPYDYDTTHGTQGWTIVSQLQAGRFRRLVRPAPGIDVGSVVSRMALGSHVLWDGSRAPIYLRTQQALTVCDGLGADVLPSAFAAGEVVFEFTVGADAAGQTVSYVS